MENRSTPLCILVVEDDLLVRAFIADVLREKGHFVVEATTGEEAVALLEAEPDQAISVLFTDIQLGGRITGWEVAEAFRKAKPKVPVLYASGRGRDAQRQVPGSVFFDKPYLPGDVLQAIEDAPLG